MSLIIAVHVEEGIVLASDSRITYNSTSEKNIDGTTIQEVLYGIHYTDSTYKTFLCPNNIGIATCGDASINGKPITGFIEHFIMTKLKDDTDVDDVPALLNNYFKKFTHISTYFLICGYRKENKNFTQSIWGGVVNKDIAKRDTSFQGAAWSGEYDILERMFNPAYKKTQDSFRELPNFPISWNFFTLQDAVDFAKYAIKITIDTMKFQQRIKTVGGDIDILVLKPNKSFWINQKKIKVDSLN